MCEEIKWVLGRAIDTNTITKEAGIVYVNTY